MKKAHIHRFPTSTVKPKSYRDKTQRSFVREACIDIIPHGHAQNKVLSIANSKWLGIKQEQFIWNKHCLRFDYYLKVFFISVSKVIIFERTLPSQSTCMLWVGQVALQSRDGSSSVTADGTRCLICGIFQYWNNQTLTDPDLQRAAKDRPQNLFLRSSTVFAGL